MNGVISSFKKDKGFGFIMGEDGVEYFFHRSAVKNTEFDSLGRGRRVTFTASTGGEKGPRTDEVNA